MSTTTYTLSNATQLPGLGLLAVNAQVRSETLPIFYGENIFVFDQTPTIVPFMKDRTMAARRLIRHIDLILYVDHHDGFHADRQAEYVNSFRYLSRFVNLKQLDCSIIYNVCSLPKISKPTGSKKQWLRTLSEIHGLGALDIRLHFPRHDWFIDMLSLDGDDDDEEWKDEIKAVRCQITDAKINLEEHLKSRMLKKKRRPLDKWLKDHVCTRVCDEVTTGRAATRPGLPQSDTHGQWTLPEVDLDALYDSGDPDVSSEEGYDSNEEEFDEDENLESSDSEDDDLIF
ncbi:MAG: hypothetical protein Q9186_000859 [Xanthomendoza sp. 1 TL-2023]